MPKAMRALRAVMIASAVACPLAAQSPEGVWTGIVNAPQGGEPIAFAIARLKSGHLAVTMTMPVMFVDRIRLPLEDDGAGNYAIGPLDTTFQLEGKALVGSFALGHLPMRLTRGGEVPAASVPPKPPDGPAPAWTLALGGKAWASPVVRDSTVYVGTTDGVMHAVRAGDGAGLWKWTGTSPLYGAALATDASILFLDDSCSLVCLDRATGKLRWRTDLRDGLTAGATLPANPSYNHRTPAPVIADGVIYIGSADGGIYAIDPATGEKRWRSVIGGPVLAEPAVAGDALFVADLDGSLVVIARKDGKEQRRTKFSRGVVSAPVVVGGVAVVGCRDYMLYGLKVADLSVAWRFSYWFSWVESAPSTGRGIIYIGSSDYRRVSAIEASTGRVIWGTDVGGLTWGTPLIAGNRVYAGAAAQRGAILTHVGGLVAIDRTTGGIEWRYPVPLADGMDRSGFIGSLALARDLVVGVTFDGTLMAFPPR